MLSVVMAAYNAERHLRQAIESVLAQTFHDFEFIIVDDGSSDSTLAVARMYAERDARIRILSHPNVGMGRSLNEAIGLARFEWIARMDADDVMLPYRLDRQTEFLRANPSVAVAATLVYYIDERGRRMSMSKSDFTTLEATRTAVARNEVIHFQHPSVVMRKAVVMEVGGYRPEYWPADDIDLWNRIAERGYGVVAQPEPLLEYRVHGSSVTVASAKMAVWKAEWVEECMVRRRAGRLEPGWDEFVLEHERLPRWHRLRERCRRLGRTQYKIAAYRFAQGRYAAFGLTMACALVLDPRFVLVRLRDRWRGRRKAVSSGKKGWTVALLTAAVSWAAATSTAGLAPVAAQPVGRIWYVDVASDPRGGSTRTIGEAVARASPGDRIVVRPGTYRETVVVSKSIELVGDPGATIKGSDVWSGFSREGPFWTKLYPYEWERRGECQPTSNGRCSLADQVFIDGQAQFQETARSEVKPGSFYVGDGKLHLGSDPSGHVVEVSTRDLWVKVETPNVTVRGFRMMHSRVIAQFGALTDGGQPRGVFEGNDLSLAHGAAVRIDGDGAILRRNHIHSNGQLGIVGHGANMRIEGNVISHNNTEGFSGGWEAGGAKLKQVRNLVIEGNESFANDGLGLWCDIDCDGVNFQGNRVHHNSGPGIVFEISFNCVIEGNVVWENGYGVPIWAWGAGILVQNSSGCDVRNNVVAWNATSGISVIHQDRGPRWTDMKDNVVHHNVIASLARFQIALVSDMGVDLNRHGNRSYANRVFRGRNPEISRSLEAAGIPLKPER